MNRQESQKEYSEEALQYLKLRYFRLVKALADTGKISAAAVRLNMTQPAASRLLNELEELLGTKLYERHPRGVHLTKSGEHLAERSREILRKISETAQDIAEISAGKKGVVAIGSVTGPALEIVLPLLRETRKDFPDININLIVGTSARMASELINGSLDFYIGRIPDDLLSSNFLAYPIAEEPLSLTVRAGHPLTDNPPKTLHDCLKYDWVMQESGNILRRAVERYFHKHLTPLPTRVISTSSQMMTLAIVENFDAIAPLARAVVDFYSKQGNSVVTLPIGNDIAIETYSLVTFHDRSLSPSAEVFYKIFLNKLNLPRHF